MAAPPEALGLVMLEDDPHGWRLDRAAQVAAVRDALADGAAAARTLRKRFPDLTPAAMAQQLGVPVETTDDDPMVGSLWRFAEYRERPPHILLYRRGLASLDRTVTGRLLGQATAQDVFVAHELFHHIEADRPDMPIARRHQPTLFRIGNWHWRTGIAALAEIAAGSFAQSLLRLPCHPRALDLVALDAICADTAAARIAARVAAIGQ